MNDRVDDTIYVVANVKIFASTKPGMTLIPRPVTPDSNNE
jgi:hypothetical protein